MGKPLFYGRKMKAIPFSLVYGIDDCSFNMFFLILWLQKYGTDKTGGFFLCE